MAIFNYTCTFMHGELYKGFPCKLEIECLNKGLDTYMADVSESALNVYDTSKQVIGSFRKKERGVDMVTEQIILSKMYKEIQDYPLVRLFYNIKGTNKIYLVTTLDNVDTGMNTRIFIGNLEDKYKTKLDCQYVKNSDVPKILRQLEEHDEDIITFGNYIELEEVYIDKDIRIPILQLNDAGFKTRFSCSGHGNLKQFYIMFEYEPLVGYIVPLAKGGLFDVIVSNNILDDRLRVNLRLNCTQELNTARITSKEIMDAIVDLLVYKKTETLANICKTCADIRQDNIFNLTLEKDKKIEKFLNKEITIGE